MKLNEQQKTLSRNKSRNESEMEYKSGTEKLNIVTFVSVWMFPIAPKSLVAPKEITFSSQALRYNALQGLIRPLRAFLIRP